MPTETAPAEQSDVQYAVEGSGPLLQRDYWAALRGVDRTPEEVADVLRRRFVEFAPPETAAFRCNAQTGQPLKPGDEMEIRITLLGRCDVRVVHEDACSLTLRTLKGHPEAGRITFAAYREGDRLMFRIRSRTRQASLFHYLGYLVMGKQLQSRCWIKFIWRLAEILGGTVDGSVHVKTQTVKDRPADWGAADTPTFACGGGN
jgi:hypothetical protein